MTRVVHYIGFRDDAYLRAFRIWGGPVMIHRVNDTRTQSEIDPVTDIAIYAGTQREGRIHQIPGTDVTGPGWDRP